MDNEDRADWGRQAVAKGTPDYRRNGLDADGFRTDAGDAIANILHAVVESDNPTPTEGWTTEVRELVQRVLNTAVVNLSEELDEPATGIVIGPGPIASVEVK